MDFTTDPPYVLIYTVGTTERFKGTYQIHHKGSVPWSHRWKTFAELPNILFSNVNGCYGSLIKEKNEIIKRAKEIIIKYQLKQQRPRTKGELFFGACKLSHRNNLYNYILERDERFRDSARWLEIGRYPERESIDNELHIVGLPNVGCTRGPYNNGNYPILYHLEVSHIMTFKRAYEELPEYRYKAIHIKPLEVNQEDEQEEIPYIHLVSVPDEIINQNVYKRLRATLNDAQNELEKLSTRKRSRICPDLFDKSGKRRIKITVPHEGCIKYDIGKSYDENLDGKSYSYDICALGTEDSFYFGNVNDCMTVEMFKMLGSKAVGQAPKYLYGEDAETFLEEIESLKINTVTRDS